MAYPITCSAARARGTGNTNSSGHFSSGKNNPIQNVNLCFNVLNTVKTRYNLIFEYCIIEKLLIKP
jgi:hypothetical protein